MVEQYAALFERIRDHCRQQGWYGPDAEAPANFSNRYVRSISLKTGEMTVHDRWADLRISRFPYSPASADQLQATEAQLGMPLPLALRALYATVGNGGFGPAYGIVGATGGAPSDDVMPDLGNDIYAVELYSSVEPQPAASTSAVDPSAQDNTPARSQSGKESTPSHREEHGQRPAKDRTLAATLWRSNWRLPEQVVHTLEQEPDRFLECEEKPDGWVTLCHWGCGIFSHLDLWTGRIYLSYAVKRHDVARDPFDISDEDLAVGLEYQATSVEDWLDRWLSGELKQGTASRLTLLSDMTGS